MYRRGSAEASSPPRHGLRIDVVQGLGPGLPVFDPRDQAAASLPVQTSWTNDWPAFGPTLRTLRTGYFYATRKADEQRRLEQLIARATALCAGCTDPQAVFLLLLRQFEACGASLGYLELLLSHEWLLRRLVTLLDASPALGEVLALRPDWLDDVIRAAASPTLRSREELARELAVAVAACRGDEDAILIALRRFKQAALLEALMVDLSGEVPLEAVSDHLTDLAETLLDAVLREVAQRLNIGEPPIAVIAYGKLGSREMSYNSDTDIVLLMPDDAGDEGLVLRYAHRVNQWLTQPTAAGILYETDFRLRPYGDAGLLVCTLGAFERYQNSHAWTWEHQALVRARACAGNRAVGQVFEALRRELLQRPRDPGKLREAVTEMRERMLQHRGSAADPAPSQRFDVKHDRGGIIDVEFIGQWLVLRHGATHPDLIAQMGNIRLLRRAADNGLLDPRLAEQAAAAYRQYRRWLHEHRLRGNEDVSVPSTMVASHIDVVRSLWEATIGAAVDPAKG